MAKGESNGNNNNEAKDIQANFFQHKVGPEEGIQKLYSNPNGNTNFIR